MAAPTCGITVIKRFSYRGVATEEWSNHYLLTGSTPADQSAWQALFDALAAAEVPLLTVGTSIVAGYGYDQPYHSGLHAIWSVDMTLAPRTPPVGTLTGSGGSIAPGDSAVWVRWGLDRFNSKGKRVYLRKYYHPGLQAASGDDHVMAIQKTRLDAFGTKMWDGTFLAGRKICSKTGEVPIGSQSSTWVTTRSLKRRGKRPPT